MTRRKILPILLAAPSLADSQIISGPFRGALTGGGGAVLPSGFVARWKASSLTGHSTGDAIAAWPDSSGNGYDLTQSTGALQPLYTTFTTYGQPGVFFQDSAASWMKIPAGLSTNRQALTVCVISEHGTRLDVNVPVAFGAGNLAGYFVGPTYTEPPGTYNYNGGSPVAATGIGAPAVAPICTIWEFGSSQVTVQNNQGTYTNSAVSGGTNSGGYVGIYDGTNFRFNGTIYEILIYGSALSSFQRAALLAYANVTYKSPRTIQSANIVCGIDSITQGTGATYGMSWPQILSGAFHGAYSVRQNGIAAQALSDVVSDPARLNNGYDAAYARNICVIFGGTNDIYQNGGTAASAFASLVTVCQNCRTQGFTNVVVTMLPRDNAGDAARLSFNSMITGDSRFTDGTLASAIADAGANSQIGAYPANPSYYSADLIHPNDAGYAILAPIIQSALSGLLP